MSSELKLTIRGEEVDVLPLVPESARAGVVAAIKSAQKRPEGFVGVLEPEDITAAAPLTIDELAMAMTAVASAYAYTPVSKFNVGTAAYCGGRLVCGCNMEWGRCSLATTVHGEQAAVVLALRNAALCRRPKDTIDRLYVNEVPCGHCRQWLAEQEYIQDHPLAVHVRGRAPVASVKELLPDAFTPEALGKKPGRTLPPEGIEMPFELQANNIASLAGQAFWMIKDVSRAPYTKCFTAAAVSYGLSSCVAEGACIENCAFNPTMQAISSAFLASTFMGKNISEIADVLLMETPGGSISNREITEMIVKEMAPKARFHYAQLVVRK